jgi:hypothetical protein
MYLWKYWRETRILFGACLLGIAILFALILREHVIVASGNVQMDHLTIVLITGLVIQILPVSLVGWLMGSYGVGRDLGEKSGSYLFTRPGSRASFVWRDWGFGAAQLLTIIVLINLVLAFQIYSVLLATGDSFHGTVMLGGTSVPLIVPIGLNAIATFLLAALVFSITYFSTVLLRHSRGLLLGAGVLIGYLILQGIAKHYWPGVHLPNLFVLPFAPGGRMSTGLADHLGLSLAIRAAIVLLFPFAAQLVLEKADL